MESETPSKDKNKDNPNDISSVKLKNIKSNYILSKIYANLVKKKSLQIFQYNKKLQNRLNLDIKNYKEYLETFTPIEIEVIPAKGKYGKFIIVDENDKLYYHIYFNDNKEEIKNKYEIYKKDKVKKIKIIIDYQVKSLESLFFVILQYIFDKIYLFFYVFCIRIWFSTLIFFVVFFGYVDTGLHFVLDDTI